MLARNPFAAHGLAHATPLAAAAEPDVRRPSLNGGYGRLVAPPPHEFPVNL